MFFVFEEIHSGHVKLRENVGNVARLDLCTLQKRNTFRPCREEREDVRYMAWLNFCTLQLTNTFCPFREGRGDARSVYFTTCSHGMNSLAQVEGGSDPQLDSCKRSRPHDNDDGRFL